MSGAGKPCKGQHQVLTRLQGPNVTAREAVMAKGQRAPQVPPWLNTSHRNQMSQPEKLRKAASRPCNLQEIQFFQFCHAPPEVSMQYIGHLSLRRCSTHCSTVTCRGQGGHRDKVTRHKHLRTPSCWFKVTSEAQKNSNSNHNSLYW